MGEYEQTLLVFAEASGAASGPFLSLSDTAANNDAFAAAGNPSSGAASIAGQATGTGQPAETRFDLAPPLSQAYYLNLSKPVRGTLFWQSQLSAVAGREAAEIRVEVWAGARRVGGDEFRWTAYQAPGAWVPFYFQFRPEVSQLNPGDVLSLRVSRAFGLADFILGTGGSQQSFIEFRYFPFDPLAGAAYVENGRIVFLAPEAAEDGSNPSSGPALLQAYAESPAFAAGSSSVHFAKRPAAGASEDALGALALAALAVAPAAALVAPAKGRRGRSSVATLLVLLFLAGALSGCLGGAKKEAAPVDSGSPSATIQQTFVENETLAQQGVGAVEGVVTDEIGVPLKAARVSVLGTNLFTTTDGRGEFAFQNVSAGQYVMRVEADKFVAIEQAITVEKGRITRLDIRLQRVSAETSNQKPHVHGEWDESGQILYFDQDVNLCSTASSSGACPKDGGAGNEWRCGGINAGAHDTGLAQAPPCETRVPIDMNKPLSPGTGRVEVTLDWQPTGNAPRQLGLRIHTATNTTEQAYVFRGPKDPFNIQVFPNEADPGHQKFTQWNFWIRVPERDLYMPVGPALYQGGRVHVTVKLFRTVVPFEPAHLDRWNGLTELPLLVDKAINFACNGCALPSTGTALSWPMPKGLFVPPGTLELTGSMRWVNAYPTGEVWDLAYKPASLPLAYWNAYDSPKATMDPTSGTARTFTIPVKPADADQFYQQVSYWLFMVDDEYRPADRALPGYGPNLSGAQVFLTVTAIKDPQWKDA